MTLHIAYTYIIMCNIKLYTIGASRGPGREADAPARGNHIIVFVIHNHNTHATTTTTNHNNDNDTNSNSTSIDNDAFNNANTHTNKHTTDENDDNTQFVSTMIMMITTIGALGPRPDLPQRAPRPAVITIP